MADKNMPDDKKNATTPKLTLGGGASTLHLSVDLKKTPAPKKRGALGVQVEVVGAKRRSVPLTGATPAGGLTRQEQETRMRALKLAEEEDRRRKEREEIEAKERAVREAEEAVRRSEEERVRKEEEARVAQEAAEQAKRAAAPVAGIEKEASREENPRVEEKTADESAPFELTKKNRKLLEQLRAEKDEEVAEKPSGRTKTPTPGTASKKRSGRITVSQVLREEASFSDDQASLGSDAPRRRVKRRSNDAKRRGQQEKVLRDVAIPDSISVQDLALRMAERATDVVRVLMKMGVMAAPSQTIDADTAELAAQEMGHRPYRVQNEDPAEFLYHPPADAPDTLEERSPVVTFMGHVDHGKTSLLDAIRESKVAAGEAGGITQHIGAYQVTTPKGSITFLDTPGHAAFTAMRQRGAGATDIVVLVVAADDGIMQQTEEAISHARAAGAPIIVAINKVDKPEANPQKVRDKLLHYELIPEELGGDVMTAEVSAKTGAGLDRLLECILLQAEVMELGANPDRPAVGVVIESRIDKARGAVATILVQRGTLNIGDVLVSGTAYGRVRAMTDAAGNRLQSAGPSDAVEVLGLSDAPHAGSPAAVAENERMARDVALLTDQRARAKAAAMNTGGKSSMDLLLEQFKGSGIRELPVVIKTDVQGSLEAIEQSLLKFNNDEVAVRVLHKGVGGITESDVSLAAASSAMVLGFNVRAEKAARDLATRDRVDVQYYSVIYDLIDDVKAMLSDMLKPSVRENMLGNAEIRDVFVITRAGKVAGCYVTDGTVKRGAHVRLLRDNVVIHQGKLKTLRRFKDDVQEVASGYECGMAFERYDDIKIGDYIEAFEMVEEKRTL
ncbi:MAG: translation initiation factor IF-2 [Rickettsiales bacterium]